MNNMTHFHHGLRTHYCSEGQKAEASSLSILHCSWCTG